MSKTETRYEVANKFVNQTGAGHAGGMVATPRDVYSYDACIATRLDAGCIKLTARKYSSTTSAHTSAVRDVMEANGYRREVQHDEWEMWLLPYDGR